VIEPDVRAFIDAQRIARLATVDERGQPHVVPICFALDGDTLYHAIDEKPKRPGARLRRIRNIEANPQVQVLFDAYDDGDWSALRYAQLRGRGRILDSGAERESAIALLRARYAQYREMALSTVVAVDVERVVEWRGA
jgi:PPOX class probable F420-dependent enzyme